MSEYWSIDEHYESPFVVQETIEEVRRRVELLGPQLGVGGGGLHFDARRYAVTIEYMRKFNLSHGNCVEIGNLAYLSSRVIWSFFPNAKPTGTKVDLRRTPLPFDDGSVSNLLCTEVIEHISDIEYGQATTLDGLFYFLDEVWRVLEVGGRALISTPNASSFFAIKQALMGQVPMMYPWHFREFTKKELCQVLERCGFEIVVHNTEFVWHLWNFSDLYAFMEAGGYSLSDRGDDQFVIVQKAGVRNRKAHELNLP